MPAFRQEKSIVSNMRSVCLDLDRLGIDYELIVVVDGFVDKTFENAKKFAAGKKRVRVFGYKTNAGKGNAIKHGCSFVKKPLTAFVDSGLDLPISQIRLFLDYIESFKADVVIGSKRHPLSSLKYPLLRRFLSFCYSTFIKLLFNLDVSDTQVGFKLLRSSVVRKVMPLISVKRFAFDLEVLVVAKKLGYRIIEAPVVIDFGKIPSTVNLKAIASMFWETLTIFYRKNIMRHYDR